MFEQPKPATKEEQQAWDDSVTATDLRMWEDELIYHEIEDGLTPWVFNSEQQHRM